MRVARPVIQETRKNKLLMCENFIALCHAILSKERLVITGTGKVFYTANTLTITSIA